MNQVEQTAAIERLEKEVRLLWRWVDELHRDMTRAPRPPETGRDDEQSTGGAL